MTILNDQPVSRYEIYQHKRIEHWDKIAQKTDHWKSWGRFYQSRLHKVYRLLISPNQRVLELGCGQGDLLSAVKPSVGIGVDFSSEMIARARQRHPHLNFIIADSHDFNWEEKFDVIILSDLVNDVWDVQKVLSQVSRLCTPATRILINFYSRVWEPILSMASAAGLSTPILQQNWLTIDDLKNLLGLEYFDVIRTWQEVLWPLPISLMDRLFNQLLVKFWPFNLLALTNFILARSLRNNQHEEEKTKVSVVVPARNESGNIAQILARVPKMGAETELIFVEGHSRDDTYQVIEEEIQKHPEQACKLVRQSGVGKGDAVRLGFSIASGDVLMILDADLTVSPEYLPRFLNALLTGNADFVNGVRLVYPMEKQAMRFFNFIGNKFFSLAFSWLLGQPIKDTLCGTKVLWKKDYDRIVLNRSYFGDFDPFGDYDLLFGATKLGLRIIDLPIRYQERVYGTTNIQRWKHGWLLLRMTAIAAARLKFV